MKHRDQTTYRGRFATLKLHAFGIEQLCEWEADIEIYQARSAPALWRARPHFEHGSHKWEASTPNDLMTLIAADFVTCVHDWETCVITNVQPRPTLLSPAAPTKVQRAG